MKKIRSVPKYRKYQKQRQRRAQNASLRARRRRSQANRVFAKRQARIFEKELGFARLTAPSNFSFVNNAEEFIDFLNDLKQILYEGRSTVIDLTAVEEITNDALIALFSVIQDKSVKRSVRVYVDRPANLALVDRLEESGIHEYAAGFDTNSRPAYGRIKQKSSVEADMAKANELIQFATRQIFGQKRRLLDVQRILSECIDNTTFHANPNRQLAEMWWATVFCQSSKGIAYFSIMDNGIGIIDSLKTEWVRELGFRVKYKDNAALLKDVFEGGVLSRTKKTNRGKGLPAMMQARKRGEFERLIVISGNVYIDFDRGIYKVLRKSFKGTFFYWEVRKGNDDGN